MVQQIKKKKKKRANKVQRKEQDLNNRL